MIERKKWQLANHCMNTHTHMDTHTHTHTHKSISTNRFLVVM